GLGILTDGVIATTNPLDDISDNDKITPARWIGWNQLIASKNYYVIKINA
ncbi:hypothetical protein WUBG_16274, partial [Wuchereria bancrofti]